MPSGKQCGRRWWSAILAIAGAAGSPAVLLAQAGSHGVGEVSGYGGLTVGPVGTRAAAGASTGLAFSRYASGLMDFSYMPLGAGTLQSFPPEIAIKGSALFDLNLSLHIRIPAKRRWEPYGILGAGVLFSSYQLASRGGAGVISYASRSDTDLGFETGAGFRYFVKRNWGVRTEMRYTVSHRSFGRILTGVFYQFEHESGFGLQ
jgi:opacity protein-like surface antigen